MIYVTATAVIPRRPEVVWGYLTDVTRLTTWVESLVLADCVTDQKTGVGVTLDVVRSTRKGRTSATSEVTAWREPELLCVETRFLGALLFDRARLAPVEVGPAGSLGAQMGTELVIESELMVGNKVAEIFGRSRGLFGADDTNPFQPIYDRSLDALARLIEAETMRPYR